MKILITLCLIFLVTFAALAGLNPVLQNTATTNQSPDAATLGTIPPSGYVQTNQPIQFYNTNANAVQIPFLSSNGWQVSTVSGDGLTSFGWAGMTFHYVNHAGTAAWELDNSQYIGGDAEDFFYDDGSIKLWAAISEVPGSPIGPGFQIHVIGTNSSASADLFINKDTSFGLTNTTQASISSPSILLNGGVTNTSTQPFSGNGSGLTNNNSALSTLLPQTLVSSNQAALIAQASAGGGTANAYLTNNPNATTGFTNPVAGIFVSNLTATALIITNGYNIGSVTASNIYIVVGNIPFIQIAGSAGTSGHFVIGSTNNTLIPDASAVDGGVGVVGGQFNNIADTSGNHMVTEYIYGGYSNTVETLGSGGNLNSFTNNDILGSMFSQIWVSLSSGTPTWNNHIHGSMYSAITNNIQFLLMGDDSIYDGSNSLILANSGVNIYSSLAIGPNITITNSDVKVISAGENAVTTPTTNMVILNAPNGVAINTNVSPGAALTISGAVAASKVNVGQTAAISGNLSPSDSVTVGGQFYGYFSVSGTNSSSNVGLEINQNGAGGSANNSVQIGIVGTNVDTNYGLRTNIAQNSLSDFVIQMYVPGTGTFTNILRAPVTATSVSLAPIVPVGPNTAGTIINTNWILGAKYSFPYPVMVSANATITLTGVSGDADLELEVAGNTTNRYSIQTTASSIAESYTNYIGAFVPANTTFDYTNRSVGAGDSSGITGGQYIIW